MGLASAQRGMTQTQRRAASARSGLEGLPLSKSHEDVMHVFWCSQQSFGQVLFQQTSSVWSLQGPVRSTEPEMRLAASRTRWRQPSIQHRGIFSQVASYRQLLRLISDLDAQHSLGKAVSDMRSHFPWK